MYAITYTDPNSVFGKEWTKSGLTLREARAFIAKGRYNIVEVSKTTKAGTQPVNPFSL